ncbi:hypothetical protein ACN38_g13233 [Penicillium nordicum]|uniref:Uncharacterized protein n=1 Tax=Penicillium nordicum TaxID=229535 RepID=A0A0M9W979_9EURO|nr:hypothetical protein ACN38_g13233 [Penicillium nordicum]
MCDNQQTVDLLTKEGSTMYTKLRHVDINRSWMKQEVKLGGVSKCKVAYMDLQGIIPWRSCDFQYWIYHILRLVIITAQIVEIAGFVILES